MKKLFTALLFLFTLSTQGQPLNLNQSITYDMSLGDTLLTTNIFQGFSLVSFQFDSESFSATTSEISIQQTNNGKNYLDISGTAFSPSTGTETNFVELVNAQGTRYRINIDVNTVVSGTLNIRINIAR